MYSTQIHKEHHQNSINFNCATVEKAIASMIDLNGNNEYCKNIYDIKCKSSKNENLILSNEFTYYPDEIMNREMNNADSQKLFYRELHTDNQFYKFELNSKREIIRITKIK